jgi:uncharacterized protein DUF3467
LGDEDGRIEARYANHLEIGQTPFEFLLDFGQSYEPGEQTVLTHTRVVTSPYYAKHFSDLLRESVRRYEERNGTIPDSEP